MNWRTVCDIENTHGCISLLHNTQDFVSGLKKSQLHIIGSSKLFYIDSMRWWPVNKSSNSALYSNTTTIWVIAISSSTLVVSVFFPFVPTIIAVFFRETPCLSMLLTYPLVFCISFIFGPVTLWSAKDFLLRISPDPTYSFNILASRTLSSPFVQHTI